MSDLDDFMSETRPSGKASKLDPYLVEIDTLEKTCLFRERYTALFGREERIGCYSTNPEPIYKNPHSQRKGIFEKRTEAENTVMNKESNKHETVRCQDALNPQRVESATDGKPNWQTPIPRDEILD